MEIREFDVEGLLEILPKKHEDERGYFAETFRLKVLTERIGPVELVQDNQSLSVRAGTIRGIHFQTHPYAQAKLVRCTAGSVADFAIDLRCDSATYGKWTSLVLSAEKLNQFWLPVGFGHAFCTLEPNSVISYRVTNYYSAEHDKGVAWDDPAIGIDWPEVADPDTLSSKDRALPAFADLPQLFSVKGR